MMSKFLNQYYLCIFLLVIIYIMGKTHFRLEKQNRDLAEEVKALKAYSQKNDNLTAELFTFERGLHERTQSILDLIPDTTDCEYSDDFMQLYRAGLGY